jgi:uncharacterized membrane protein
VSLYEVLLFVHVLAVIAWLGGGIMIQLIAERAVRSNDVTRIRTLLDDSEAIGKRFFGPATGIAFLSGLWLVFEGDWGFDHLFILGGLAGFVISSVIGFALIQPSAGKVLAAMGDGGGTITDETKTSLDRVRNLSRLDLTVLAIVVFLMTVKPGS